MRASVFLLSVLVIGGLAYFRPWSQETPTVGPSSAQEEVAPTGLPPFGPLDLKYGKATMITDPALIQGVTAFIGELSQAFLDLDQDHLAELYAIDTMYDYARHTGIIQVDDMESADRIQDRQETLEAIREELLKEVDPLSDDPFRIRRIHRIREEQVKVYVSLKGSLGSEDFELAWSLILTPRGTWRIFDTELVANGLCESLIMGILSPSVERAAWIDSLRSLLSSFQEFDHRHEKISYRWVENSASLVLDHSPPPLIAALAHTLRSHANIYLEEPESALVDIEKAIALTGSSPSGRLTQGRCYIELNEHGLALEALNLYAEIIGWDTLSHELAAICHLQEGTREEAVRHAEACLAEYEDSLDSITVLALCLPKERFGEVHGHLQAASEKELAYEWLLDSAMNWERPEVTQKTLDLLKLDFPKSELFKTYGE